MRSSQARATDFYSIVPLPGGFYVLVVDGTVAECPRFRSMDEAEDYVVNCYEDLKPSRLRFGKTQPCSTIGERRGK